MAAQSRLQVSRVAALRGRARIREDLQPVPGIEWIMARAGHQEAGAR